MKVPPKATMSSLTDASSIDDTLSSAVLVAAVVIEVPVVFDASDEVENCESPVRWLSSCVTSCTGDAFANSCVCPA